MTVLIATYGDPCWERLADRAEASARDQAPVIRVHGATLAQARNEAVNQAASEWVVHLDADDELEPGYIEAVEQGTADVRAPAVRYIVAGRARYPRLPHVYGHRHWCTGDCLPEGNWIVVGAAVRTELVRRVGGWREFDWSEDWDLWLRCHLAGATVAAVPAAVYRAHVRPDSRNRAPDHDAKIRAHRAIYDANFNGGPVPCARS